jgi:hypothetical protein
MIHDGNESDPGIGTMLKQHGLHLVVGYFTAEMKKMIRLENIRLSSPAERLNGLVENP